MANDTNNPLKGEVVEQVDSVLVAYDDLRIANSKLIELKYEKDINERYRNIIANDSIIIKDYNSLTIKLNKDCKKAIKQRNIAISGGALAIIFATILLLVK